ncbi:MAG: hypothetical protein HY401_05720 [Elusimicrobia bacterium]|nr:hypothetical protein [Elusimicrobiota bacterium]
MEGKTASPLSFSWKGAAARVNWDELIKKWKKENQPLGFLSPPGPDETKQLRAALKPWKGKIERYCLIGIGGSALPAKSLLSFINPKPIKPRCWVLDTIDPATIREHPALQTDAMAKTLFHIVSKSGATMEVELLRRRVLQEIESRQIQNWKERFLVTTTPAPGNLLQQWAARNRIPILPLDENIGGRFSSFSAVTYAAAEFSGISLDDLREGARWALAAKEAASRYAELLLQEIKRKRTVLGFFLYGDCLTELGQLLLQLFAESLGKEGRGLTPTTFIGTRDQHSLLQLYLGGPADKMATIIWLDQKKDQPLGRALWASAQGVAQSLKTRRVPVFQIQIHQNDAKTYGCLVQFFHLATIALGHLMGVNPFDQPMVDLQKKYTQELLGR